MFFWHIGATIAFVRYTFRDEAMDLRYLAVGAVLPNLLDIPVAVAMWTPWQAPRLVAHSLLFGSMLMAGVLVVTSRGVRRKRWMLVSIGALIHLVLDAMWADPNTLWWPFLGWEFTSSGISTVSAYVGTILSDPWMWAGEIVGLAYLAFLWSSSGLSNRDARRRLLSTGVVSAPIHRK